MQELVSDLMILLATPPPLGLLRYMWDTEGSSAPCASAHTLKFESECSSAVCIAYCIFKHLKKMSSEPHILSTRHRSCGSGSRCLPLGYLMPSGWRCPMHPQFVAVALQSPAFGPFRYQPTALCGRKLLMGLVGVRLGGRVMVCRHECQTMLRYACGRPS